MNAVAFNINNGLFTTLYANFHLIVVLLDHNAVILKPILLIILQQY